MSVFIGHSSGSKPSVAAAAAADILEAELALGGTPGASRYYGTNGSSVRGFYPLPTVGPGGSTNLGIGFDAVSVTLTSSSGSGVIIPAATITLAGAMTAADRVKLNGIAENATQNASDSALRDRATHTGTQPMGTISGLALALAGKADLSSAAFGNLSSTDYFAIYDTSSSFTLTLEFAESLTNDNTIWFPNQSGVLALVGHTHTADNLTDATPLGKAVMRLTNPPATRFAAFDAAGTVTLLDEPNFRSAIGACAGDDARLSDARTPTAHTHPAAAISDSTTLGRSLMTLADPLAVRYIRINADNSVSLLDAAAFAAAIGAGAGSPAGSGTELQFKSGGAFGALPGSSVSGSALTLAELRVNAGDPATGLRGTHAGGVTTLAFFGTGANGFFYGATGSTALAYRGAGFRIEGTGSADAAALFQIGISNRVILRVHTLNNLRLGPADAASPAPQSLSVQSASGTNQSAASATFIIDGAQGTGSGNGGAVCIRTAPGGASGASLNALVDTITARPGRGVAISNGNFSAPSDCIGEFTVLRGATSGTTPVILSESALGGGLPVLPNTVIQGIVLVQGMSESGETARFARQVCVRNVAGTTSLHSAVAAVGVDDSTTTALSITANDTADTLDIQVTGTSGANWRWSAVIFGGELARNVPS